MTGEVWAVGDAYDAYVGRWSRLVAARFLSWLDVDAGRRWLDVGCGTGALAGAVLETAEPAAVVGVDASQAFAAYASSRIDDPRAAFCTADARALPLASGCFDAVLSALALNFVPDPAYAVAECARVTVAGGVVAAYVWDYAEGMGMLRHFWDAASALDPAAATLDEARRFPLCRPEPLEQLWTAAGLRQVTVTALEVPTAFTDVEDYWRPFLGGQGPAPGYVKTRSPEQRSALLRELAAGLPLSPDGSVHLTARAWAVRGTVVI